ncbi:hypothetical protein, conserved [Eimeria tenella]|uniref:Uncharacterized protein n=1 Tax=Eimeria tenella TaxID=5802 RepID=U6KWZ5_EIMTE|nr:hypothetical protein, conserved [Eimeria tenella]CDJ40889.1 hypothetical protein, conserved [Eimeria tenella]|eukprot:XP_013231639.1 hypothetical protein, conserved [Eimeria tenella]
MAKPSLKTGEKERGEEKEQGNPKSSSKEQKQTPENEKEINQNVLHFFLSRQFWKDEENATKTMEELFARTNFYAYSVFNYLQATRNNLEKKESSVTELLQEVMEQFQTAETEAKALSEEHKMQIEKSVI